MDRANDHELADIAIKLELDTKSSLSGFTILTRNQMVTNVIYRYLGGGFFQCILVQL